MPGQTPTYFLAVEETKTGNKNFTSPFFPFFPPPTTVVFCSFPMFWVLRPLFVGDSGRAEGGTSGGRGGQFRIRGNISQVFSTRDPSPTTKKQKVWVPGSPLIFTGHMGKRLGSLQPWGVYSPFFPGTPPLGIVKDKTPWLLGGAGGSSIVSTSM